MMRASITQLWMCVACLALTSCFLGYDSRWGAEERQQRAVAADATPSDLRGTPSDAHAAVAVHRIRAYVSADYAAQIGDEKQQIERLLGDANRVLEPTLGIRLAVDELRSWPGVDNGDLAAALDALQATDAGNDAAWVVGFIGRLPLLEANIHELGMARSPGRHLVIRAMNDAAEYDALARNLDELDEAERSKLYRQRVAHKATAVFLHEIGHTLGAPHEDAATTIMNGLYHRDADSFSEAAASIMRASLAQRSQQRAQREAVAAQPHMIDLEDEERARYRDALAAQERGRFDDAWRLAEPLFEAHPENSEIQELRCQLALRRGGSAEEVLAHCAPFERQRSK